MTSITPSASLAQTAAPTSFWTNLWRVDTAYNLISGLLILALNASLLERFGASSDYSSHFYGLGVFSVVYGLWQFFTARHGQVSRASFLVGDAMMSLSGLIFLAAMLMGFKVNTLGLIMMLAYGPGAIVLAGIWFYASRQVD